LWKVELPAKLNGLDPELYLRHRMYPYIHVLERADAGRHQQHSAPYAVHAVQRSVRNSLCPVKKSHALEGL
jgi:hypothetical protein